MVTSCSQARLDEVEHLGVTEVDKTYAEADDMTAQQLIANVYVTAKYLMMGDWGVHYIATTSAKTAECWPGGSGPNDGTDYHRMSAMIDDSENNAYKEMYTRFYKIMYKCNMIVDKLNDGSDERKRVIAEAKAWRAWAMMRLTQLWGSAPLVDHVLDGINYSFYPGNSNPADNWKWIMTQFDEAATVLPSKSGLGGQKAIGGRWTAEACFAYKGQGYMWQNDYANAKVELAKVINSGKYELWEKTATMGPSSYGTNMQLAKSQNENWSDGNEEYEYLTLYRAEADFCDEFLLELDIDGDATTITSTEPYWFRAYMNWRKDEVNLPGNTTTASDGWGFVNPTRTFGYAFAKHDGNSVRRRAGLTDAPALDMDNAEYGIKAERRFELWLEDCSRYVDLIRWGDYKKFITDTSIDGVSEHWGNECAWLVGLKDATKRTTDPTDWSNYEVRYDPLSTRGSWSDRFYLWPFPYAETTQNPNLVQNTGW